MFLSFRGWRLASVTPSRQAREQVWAGKRPGPGRHLPGRRPRCRAARRPLLATGPHAAGRGPGTASQKRAQNLYSVFKAQNAAWQCHGSGGHGLPAPEPSAFVQGGNQSFCRGGTLLSRCAQPHEARKTAEAGWTTSGGHRPGSVLHSSVLEAVQWVLGLHLLWGKAEGQLENTQTDSLSSLS